MITPPVCAADFLAVIPSTADTVCQRFIKAFFTFPLLLFRFFSWFINGTCGLSDDGATWICDGLVRANCQGASTATTTTTAGSTTTGTTTAPACVPDANIIVPMTGYSSAQGSIGIVPGRGTEYNSPSNLLWRIFDGSYLNPNFAALSYLGVVGPFVAQLNLNGPVVVQGYRIWRKPGAVVNVPIANMMFGSNDGVNWTFMNTGNFALPWTADFVDITFANVTPYRYYRFWLQSNTSSGGVFYMDIAELELFCDLAATTPTTTPP